MSTASGRLGWSATAIFGPQALQFIGLLILGRLLTPAEFGAVAIVTTIAELATLLLNSGLSSYVVHVKKIEQDHISTVFWINAILGIVVGATVALMSNSIAKLFNDPDLAPLIMVSAIGFLLSIGATHLGLLQRDYRFRAIAMIDVSTMLTTQAVAITLALFGFGPFSIVIARLGGLFVQVILYFALAKWRPSFRMDRMAVAGIWRYARNVLGFNIVNFWSRNLDNVIIARSAGADILGYYSRAYSIMLLPVSLVAGAIGRVLLPTLARQQHDLALAMRTWTDYTLLSLLLGLPIVSLFLAGPEQVVLVLLGDQWGDAAIFLQILGLSIAAQLVIRPMGYVFQALGRTRAQLFIGVIATGITAISMFVGNALAGANGVAAGFTVAYSLHLFCYLIYAQKRLHLRLRLLLAPTLRLLLAAGLSAAAGVGIKESAEGLPLVAQLIAITLAVVIVYLLATVVVARPTLLRAWGLLRGREETI